MEIVAEPLPGAYKIKLRRLDDTRGSFVKTVVRSVFESRGLSCEFEEEFYSVSHKNVLRGMHFQVPPDDHVKLVYCAAGSARDVLLDLRPGNGYGVSSEVEMNALDPCLLVIPKGIAHGFLSLEDNTLMVYKTSTEYAPHSDAGILWNSFSHNWRLDAAPILSERDTRHPTLSAFVTPF